MLAVSNGRSNLDNIDALVEKIDVALLQITRDTIPLRLLVTNNTRDKILRRVTKTTLLRYPKPVNNTDELDMDLNLLDAAAYFVLSSIEVNRAPAYTKLYWRVVEEHDQSLISEVLDLNDDDLHDFINDPE